MRNICYFYIHIQLYFVPDQLQTPESPENVNCFRFDE